MSLSILSVALLAISALPVALADGETCTTNVFGVEHCRPNLSSTVRIVIGCVILGLLVFGSLIYYLVMRRKTKKADAIAAALAYNNRPSNYDPIPIQYPTQAYPFNGYGGGGPPQQAPPTYGGYPAQQGYPTQQNYVAPPGPPPMMQKESV